MSELGTLARALGGSAFFQPTLAIVSALGTVLLVRRTRPFLAGWAVLFAAAMALDALSSSPASPLTRTAWALPFTIFFVILGDFRAIWLLERLLRPDASGPAVALRAAALAFVVPVAQRVVAPFLPARDLRATFLSYEVLFLFFGSGYALYAIARRMRSLPEDTRRFVRQILALLLLQYAAWAVADILILGVGGGSGAGLALRIFPDGLYYGAFVPLAYLLAPGRLRA